MELAHLTCIVCNCITMHITICTARVVLFSVVSVRLFVCLSVYAITPETLEISSQNFQGIILWSKGRTSSKIAIWGCEGGDKTFLVFSYY